MSGSICSCVVIRVFGSEREGGGSGQALTKRYIVIGLEGDVLLDLDLIDCLENGQTVSHAGEADFFEFCVLKKNQFFT